jgi:Tol biopolymer transport system component
MDDLGVGNQRIWVVEVDGSGATQLSDENLNSIWPDYSPDGSGIMWDTSGVTRIFTPGGDPTSNMLFGISEATWSPDSKQLVGVRGGNLVVIDRAGDILTEIGVADEESPSWQRIAVE